MTDVQFETVELVDTWLHSVLSADATLMTLIGNRLIGTQSNTSTAVPYVVYALSSTRDIRTHDGEIIGTDNTYSVKAVGAGGSWSVVSPIAKRINLALGRTSATLVKGSLTCVRDRTIQDAEMVNGVQYRHLGGFYRIRASAHD